MNSLLICNNMKRNSTNSKLLLIPGISFLIVLALFLFAAQFLYGRIAPTNAKINEITLEKGILSSRISALQEIQPEVLALTEDAYIALPDTNPAAYALSHLRKLAAENLVELTNITTNVGGIEGDELLHATVEFEAQGSYEQIVTMIKQLENLSPLINIDRLQIETNSGSTYEASGALLTYWGEFPEKLPDLSEPVSSLTDEELEILNFLSQQQNPEFTELKPSNEVARPDPFSID